MKTTMHVAMLAGGVGLTLMMAGVARAGDGSLIQATPPLTLRDDELHDALNRLAG